MKTVRTFILRLLTDAGQPGGLCGSLQPVATDVILPFKNEQGLLDLLHRPNPDAPLQPGASGSADKNKPLLADHPSQGQG
jgi:hypothetical protein